MTVERKRRAGRRLAAAALALLVAAVALSVVGASAAPPSAGATAVLNWNQTAVTTLTGLPGPAGGAPPASQINMGMVQGAVYDAVNAITPKHHRPYLLNRRFGNTASDEAAVATAAYLVLKNIVETVPESITFPTRGTVLASLETQYNASKNAIPDSPSKDRGIAAGTAAAQAMIGARRGDGRFGPSQWVPNSAPGHWDPVAPNGTTAQDPTPWVGGVKPFLMQSSSQFRSAGPLPLTSAAYAADVNEVKALGGDGVVTPSTRTGTQTYIAKWWQSNPVASWNDVARQLIVRNDLDVSDAARLLATENLAAADASINTWNDKYHFDFWRPFQAIRKAALDDNLATSPDATWTPLLSAPYPDHPSGHLGVDSSHTAVLRMFFGNAPAGGYQITSGFANPGGPATRSFTSFSQAVGEIVEARIWAGLHFRTADVQAVQLGTNVANFAAARLGVASGNGSASDRSFESSLAPSVPTDPAFHGVTAGGAPWLLQRGFVEIGGRGNFELVVRGLVLTATGTAGPVTTISASLFCGGDAETTPAATTGSAPLSQAGDGRIRAKLTLPDTCLAPIVVVHPNGGLARYIAVSGWKS